MTRISRSKAASERNNLPKWGLQIMPLKKTGVFLIINPDPDELKECTNEVRVQSPHAAPAAQTTGT